MIGHEYVSRLERVAVQSELVLDGEGHGPEVDRDEWSIGDEVSGGGEECTCKVKKDKLECEGSARRVEGRS